MLKYFENVKTYEEVKKRYCELAKKLHPDNNGNTKDFQEMQNEFLVVFEKVKNIHLKNDGTIYTKENSEQPEEYLKIINELLKINDLIIDILGSWIWVSGNTKENKEKLKSLNFKYSGLKKCWYWHKGKYKRGTNGSDNLEELKEKYNHNVFYSNNNKEQIKQIA